MIVDMKREPYNLFSNPQGANNNSDVVRVLNRIQADIKKKKNNNTIKIPINQIKNVLNKIIRRERARPDSDRNARARKRRALILKNNLSTPEKTAPEPNKSGLVNNTNAKPRTNTTPSTRSPRIRIIKENLLVGPYDIEALFSVVNTYEDKKVYLPTNGAIIERCKGYQQRVNKMCKIASNYTYGDIFNSYDRRYLSNIISVIRQFCADRDYALKRREIEKIPNNNNRERQLNSLKLQLNNRRSLPINNEKMQELIELCKRDSFNSFSKFKRDY